MLALGDRTRTGRCVSDRPAKLLVNTSAVSFEGLLAGFGFVRRYGCATRQRVGCTLVKILDFVQPEPRLVDLKVGAEQRGRWHLLDGEADRLRGRVEAFVSDLAASLLAAAWKQLAGAS